MPETPSVAVLPFANLSSDAEQEYFCDGMTEEIITALSKIRGLRVISRNSAMTLKGTRKTTREIGQLLNVGRVLEGSVRKAGNNLRITAQLIDTATDAHLWAERYAGTLDDIFDIQERAARSIAEALQLKFSPDESRKVIERPVADMLAQECYRRARHEMLFATRESFDKALRLIQQGVQTIGEHPVLHMGMAQMHWLAVEWGLEPRVELLRTAVEYTRRVEAADPRYAPALLAKLERFTGSHVQAIRHFEDAVEADPGDGDSLWFLSHCYSFHAGRPANGLAVATRLLAIDPLTVMNLLSLAIAHWANADFAGALAVFDDMHRREPALRMSSLFQMHMLARLGRTEEACATAAAAVAENSEDGFAHLMMAFKHALTGRRDRLVEIIETYIRPTFWDDAEAPEWTAGWLALVGEKERAFDWLKHWVDRGGINYPMMAQGDPLLESLRGEPQFQRLLDRIRPEWEHFVPRF